MKHPAHSFVCMLALLLVGTFSIAAQEEPLVISGGVLNSKATKLPQPEYPESLKIAGIGGKVHLKILIGEDGNVMTAEHLIPEPTAGRRSESDVEMPHPLLVDAALEAARQAKFAPTFLAGKPARISGVLVYKFVAKDEAEGPGDYEGPVRVQSPASNLLNHRAISLPAPPYPPAAKAVGAFGEVKILVTVDENGRVVSASAASGHPLLKPVSVAAARQAVFEPLFEDGAPRRFTGIIVYNFALPD